jgi:hypothetical protein
MIEPALNYENTLQHRLGVYEVITGKDKAVMNHLSKPTNVLQPKSNCNTWNPTVNFSLRANEIEVSDYEVNGEQCTDEFMKGCKRNLLGYQEDSLYWDRGSASGLDQMQTAMVQTLAQGLVDSWYKTAWFSDTKFNDTGHHLETIMSLEANSGLPAAEITKLQNMLRVRNGIWSEIRAYVAAGLMKYVDSNDGTSGGNALKPANITGYLKDLKLNSDPLLRFWGYGANQTNIQRPFYLLQAGLFQQFKDYLISLGTEQSHRLVIDGIPVPGVYEWDGHVVMAVPEWTMFDNELGLIDSTTGYSKVQRAIFTVPQNITLIANMKSLEGFSGSGLIIQQSTDIIHKGKKWMYYTPGS